MLAFRLLTKSTKTNSFGLRGCILVAKDGEAWEVAVADDYRSPVYGHDYLVRTPTPAYFNLPPGERDYASQDDMTVDTWSCLGWELPHRLNKAPQKVVDKAWAGLERINKL